MPRCASVTDVHPYAFFGTFGDLPFWPGGLTLLAAGPGIGKTSWLLRMVHEAAMQGFPAAIGCYEHTAAELRYRLARQACAALGGAHEECDPQAAEEYLAQGGQSVLLPLVDAEDTVRSIEGSLIEEYGFPQSGPALLAVDYLQRIPVTGLIGQLGEESRGGEAAAALRALARRRNWAVIAACAVRAGIPENVPPELDFLLGDERTRYEPDRILYLNQASRLPCGCVQSRVWVLKDRTEKLREWNLGFWGARFFPAQVNGDVHRRLEHA